MEAAAAAKKRRVAANPSAARGTSAERRTTRNLDGALRTRRESRERRRERASAGQRARRGRGGGGGRRLPGSLDDASPSGTRVPRACYRFAAFATFAVTLTVFPAVTSSVCAAENGATSPPCLARASGSESRFAGDLWTPSLFLLFNVFDLAGRAVASVAPRRAPSGQTVLLASLARCAFDAAAAGVQRGDVAALAFPGLVQTLGRGARRVWSPRSPSRTVTWGA